MARRVAPQPDWLTMTAPPDRMFFVTLPVADVARSTAFFAAIGFVLDPEFSTEGSAACMVVGGQTRIMLGSHATFEQFSHRPMADPATHALSLFSFSVEQREEVDAVAAAALGAGGTEADGPEDHGFMYTRSFFDPDGHGWQVMWVNPTPTDAPRSAGAETPA